MSFVIKHHTYQPDIILSNGTLFWLIISLAAITLSYQQKKYANITRLIMWGCFYFYLYWLLKLTIFPIAIFKQSFATFATIGYGHIMFYEQQPLKMMQYMFVNENAMYNILGNTVMLAPLTSLLALLYQKFSHWLTMLLVSILVSGVIEMTQLLLTYFYMNARTFDIMDIITNSTGGLVIGYGTYHLLKWIFPKMVDYGQI